jgi:S-adenosylmethionine:diacylglycerol 3-amino-3-carboxypropyl transferase
VSDLVERLRERAVIARAEGDMTSACDARCFNAAIREIERLRAVNADLVEVLRAVVELEDSNPDAMAGEKWDALCEHPSLLPAARAALAKAKGK